MTRRSFALACLASALAAVLLATTASAVTYTWDPNGTGTYSDSSGTWLTSTGTLN